MSESTEIALWELGDDDHPHFEDSLGHITPEEFHKAEAEAGMFAEVSRDFSRTLDAIEDQMWGEETGVLPQIGGPIDSRDLLRRKYAAQATRYQNAIARREDEKQQGLDGILLEAVYAALSAEGREGLQYELIRLAALAALAASDNG